MFKRLTQTNKQRAEKVFPIPNNHPTKTNIEIAMNICDIIKKILPSLKDSRKLITLVNDRPGHDRRYSINPNKIKSELGWEPKFSYEKSLEITVQWYINNQDWCKKSLLKNS